MVLKKNAVPRYSNRLEDFPHYFGILINDLSEGNDVNDSVHTVFFCMV